MGKKILALVGLPIILSTCLWAGGWNNTLMGARALAIGAAFAGLADDPSAIYYNPAGLVLQEKRMNISINGVYISPTHEYSMPGGLKAESKNQNSIPQFFLTYKMNDKVTIGFGAYVPYAGGGVEFSKEELGYPFSSNLGILSLTPSISYKVSEKFSVGFNLNFYHGKLDVNTDMPGYGPMESEETGSVVSAGLGMLYRPIDKLSFGVSIRGPAKMSLTGITSITATAPGFGEVRFDLDSETNIKLPWDIEFGIAYRVLDNLVLSGSAQYTLWTALDRVEKIIRDVPFQGDQTNYQDMKFNNILIMRVGFEYAIPNGLYIRGGLGMDRAASPAETLSIRNIDVDKLTLIGGFGYRMGNTQIDFVAISAQGKEREKTSTSSWFPGTEKYNLSATILGMGVTFTF